MSLSLQKAAQRVEPGTGGRLEGWLAPLMAAGAVVVSDQPMAAPGWRAAALPGSVAEGRYFMYRVGGAV